MSAQNAAIPAQLRGVSTAALAWYNAQANGDTEYELTGLVDTDAALHARPGESYEVGLVLCDGEFCAREQVRVTQAPEGYRFALVDAPAGEIPALLDPPAGVRGGWLDNVLGKHEFVLLMFYRGLW